MKTVGIICEYNPFHLGHEHQLKEIRRYFGEDTAIIAVMSGNYVERGDLAIIDKFRRARMAVDAGVSLVLELPFPFSSASGDLFAEAAVGILDALGCVDALSFGSECGDVEALRLAAERTLSSDFVNAVLARMKIAGIGYAKANYEIYREKYGEADAALFASPNNILAIGYLKALIQNGSHIASHSIKRDGTDKDASGTSVLFAGATYIRELILSHKDGDALLQVPQHVRSTLKDAIETGAAPVTMHALSPLFLAHLRQPRTEDWAECGGGLYEHLSKIAHQVGRLEDFFPAAATKKYTDARIRRATLFSYFGVTLSHLRESVGYTQILAMDSKGQAVLHHIRGTVPISILTKPADIQALPTVAQGQAELSYRADSVYALAMPVPQAADIFLRTSPYRK